MSKLKQDNLKKALSNLREIYSQPAITFTTPDKYDEAIDNALKSINEAILALVTLIAEDDSVNKTYLYDGHIIELEVDSEENMTHEYELPFQSMGYVISVGNDLGSEKGDTDLEIDVAEFLRWQLDGTGEYTLEGGTTFDYIQFNNEYYWLPIYHYTHGQTVLRTSPFGCRWDSGCAGMIYVRKSEFKKGKVYGLKTSAKASKHKEWAEFFLSATIDGLSAEMNDFAYGYKVHRIPQGFSLSFDEVDLEEFIEDECEEVDACWGFVGENSDDMALLASISVINS